MRVSTINHARSGSGFVGDDNDLRMCPRQRMASLSSSHGDRNMRSDRTSSKIDAKESCTAMIVAGDRPVDALLNGDGRCLKHARILFLLAVDLFPVGPGCREVAVLPAWRPPLLTHHGATERREKDRKSLISSGDGVPVVV